MKLKALLLAIVSCISAVTLFAQAAYSLPPAQKPQPQNSGFPVQDLDEPVCYFQTEGGNVVDLTNLCNQPKPAPTLPTVTYPQAPNVYNKKALQDFDDSLYGRENMIL
ncbi:MAG: hypothetical protein KME16_09210 [Scytolyngbya sp. HA4215-MV1]|jgi:hypothetical protein|nr:hypothetical protein [Scytolyngbya sp. HA4215-MV1]